MTVPVGTISLTLDAVGPGISGKRAINPEFTRASLGKSLFFEAFGGGGDSSAPASPSPAPE